MPLTFFPFHLFKILHLPRKSSARSYEVQHLSRKIILANLKIWCSKVQPFSRNQRPDLLTSLMNMLLVLRLPRDMHLCGSSSNVPRLPTFLKRLQNPHVLLTFTKMQNPVRLPHETTSERPKLLRTLHFFSKRASRHNAVHFFDISLNSQNCSDVGAFFLLRHVLRATTTCTFSTSQFLKVRRSWCALYILNSKCASHHNGVQFFISHLVRWLRTRRCSEPTLRPSGATNHAKNTVHRDFSLRTCILFLLTLSLLWSSLFFSSLLWLFPPLLFHLSILSEVWLLNFFWKQWNSWQNYHELSKHGLAPTLWVSQITPRPRERNTRAREKIANVNLLFAKNGHLQMKEFRSTAVHPKSSKFPCIKYKIYEYIYIYNYIYILS